MTNETADAEREALIQYAGRCIQQIGPRFTCKVSVNEVPSGVRKDIVVILGQYRTDKKVLSRFTIPLSASAEEIYDLCRRAVEAVEGMRYKLQT
jgi:hypothetical protein